MTNKHGRWLFYFTALLEFVTEATEEKKEKDTTVIDLGPEVRNRDIPK
jgi:hypothetical protein